MSANKLSIILVSGQREQLQMAGMVASVAAVTGADVSVLVSMNALAYFANGNTDPAPHEGRMGELLDSLNAPAFRTLFEQAAELGGAQVSPCSMAMDILKLEPGDLPAWFGGPLGLTKFLDDAAEGRVLTF